MQTSEQVTTQIGDRNSSNQRTSSRRGRTGNAGSAQDSFQDSLQEGDDNRSEQNVNSNRRSRR